MDRDDGVGDELRGPQMRRRLAVTVRGAVHDPGFLARVYRLARRRQLGGSARPSKSGIEIEIEGDPADLGAFLVELRGQAPSPVCHEAVTVVSLAARDDHAFVVGLTRASQPDRATAWSG